jgi:hypothetical protein
MLIAIVLQIQTCVPIAILLDMQLQWCASLHGMVLSLLASIENVKCSCVNALHGDVTWVQVCRGTRPAGTGTGGAVHEACRVHALRCIGPRQHGME